MVQLVTAAGRERVRNVLILLLVCLINSSAALLLRTRHTNQALQSEAWYSYLDENAAGLQLVPDTANNSARGTCNCARFKVGMSKGCLGACCVGADGIGGDGYDTHCQQRTTESACQGAANAFGEKFCAWTWEKSTNSSIGELSQHAVASTALEERGTCNCMRFKAGQTKGCVGSCCARENGVGGLGFDAHCAAQGTRGGCENHTNAFGHKFCSWTPPPTPMDSLRLEHSPMDSLRLEHFTRSQEEGGTCNCMRFKAGQSKGCVGLCCARENGVGGQGFDSHCEAQGARGGCENVTNVLGHKFCAWTRITSAGPPPMVIPIMAMKTEAQAVPMGVREHLTDYVATGCYKPNTPVTSPSVVTARLQMTIPRCFLQCNKLPGMRYFALTGGHTCYCSEFPLGDRVSKNFCDVRCEGDNRQICGGASNEASVFTLFDCTPASNETQKQEAADAAAKVVAAYASFQGESCGHSDSNAAEIDNSPTMNGSAEKCMQACWHGYGAKNCNGFSYDARLNKCTFVSDVTDGTHMKDGMKTCYYKKLGLR